MESGGMTGKGGKGERRVEMITFENINTRYNGILYTIYGGNKKPFPFFSLLLQTHPFTPIYRGIIVTRYCGIKVL